MTVFLQLLAVGIATGAALSITSAGLTLVMGVGRFFHVAHGATFFVLGSLAVLLLKGFGLPLWVVFPACVLAGGVLGVLMELLVYRPILARGVSSMLVIIASLGLLYLMIYGLALHVGLSSQVAPAGPLDHVFQLGSARLDAVQLAGVGAFILILLLTELLVHRTDTGRAMRAVISSPEMASVIGIDVARVRLIALTWASAILAAPAMVSAIETGIEPAVGLSVALDATVAVILGGVGSVRGAVAASFLLKILALQATQVVAIGWQVTITYGVLILVVLIRPTGLAGNRIWRTQV